MAIVIDCHQHIGQVTGRPASSADSLDDAGLEPEPKRRADLNLALGIDYAIVMPSFEYSTTNGAAAISAVNSEITAYVSANAFAIAGLGILDPMSMPESIGEISRIGGELGLHGVVWHNRFQRVPINARPVYDAIECADSSLLFAFHCVAESTMEAPWRLEEVAAAYPNRNFLAMSSLTAWSQCAQMIAICKRQSNIYLELGALIPVGLWVERIVNEVGADRLLFGSDVYTDPVLFRYNYALAEVDAAHISEEAKERILSLNALQLFGLSMPKR